VTGRGVEFTEQSAPLAKENLQSTFATGAEGFKRLIAKPIRRVDASLAGGRITG
jgi:hypothetical protein